MFLSHFIHWILYFNIAAYRCIESIWFFYSNIFLRLSHFNTYFKTLLFGSGDKWIWWISLSFHLVSIIFQSCLLLPLIPSTPVVVVWVPQVVPVRHRALPYSARYPSLPQSYHSSLTLRMNLKPKSRSWMVQSLYPGRYTSVEKDLIWASNHKTLHLLPFHHCHRQARMWHN